MNVFTHITVVLALWLLPLLMGANPAMAFSGYLTSTSPSDPGFNVVYPSSTSGATANARCAVCHASTGGGDDLNAYGEAWAVQHNAGLTTRAAFQAIEGTNSDVDPTGASNITEINASAQPGWTAGPHNTLYDVTAAGTGAVVATNQNPPTITGILDPAAANLPPVASAGTNQAVQVGQTVQLNGSGSTDPEGHLLTYSWTITARPTGSTAALTNPTTVNPTFVPDAAGTFTVQLVVNDGTQNSTPATVTISAAPAPNLPPVANAGPNQSVNVGAAVTLDGSGSTDPERQSLTYGWTFSSRPTGSAASLTNPTTVHPTFVADVAGNYVVQLVVNDGTQNSTPATVTISAAAVNLPPVANSGPNQSVNVGQLVTLDGTASSDPERQPLTYLWTFVSRPTGSAAALTNPTSARPTFTPDVAGNYVVQLVVNDGTQNSTNTAAVTIAATAANLPPVANAGPAQAVQVGQTATVDGTGSRDPEGSALTYSWAFVSRPAGSAAALTNPTSARPTFVPDVTGQFVVGLVVNDGSLNSTNTANVVITATAAPSVNQPPVANAGPAQAVTVGTTVTLDGSKSSDPNGDPLTYTWSFVSKPAGSAAALSDASAQKPTFTADVVGQYVVGLVVNDGKVSSASSTVTITVQVAPPTGTPPPSAAVDLDVVRFRATEEVELGEGKPVRFQVTVRNLSKTTGTVPATLVGIQNHMEVYRRTIDVQAPIKKTSTVAFPTYVPTAAGKIRWTVTIQDNGTAHNTATATTEVEGKDRKEIERRRRAGS